MYICSLSSSLELPGRWTRVRRNPLHWHVSYPRRIILSDQHPWTFTHSTISYGAPSWFLLLGRIIIKVWDLSPMQRLKFLLPHNYHLNLIQIHFSPLILLLFNWILYISNLFNSGILSNFVLKNALKNFYFLLEEIYKINNIFFFKKSFFISYVGAKTWAFALGLSPTL